MPLYLRSHSRGEYVFDYSWAEAITAMAWITIRNWSPRFLLRRLPGPVGVVICLQRRSGPG